MNTYSGQTSTFTNTHGTAFLSYNDLGRMTSFPDTTQTGKTLKLPASNELRDSQVK